MKQETVWMVKNSSGLMPWCADLWKKEAIQKCLFNYHGNYTWKQLYRAGFRCVKVGEIKSASGDKK